MCKHQWMTPGRIRIQPKQPIQTKHHEGIRSKATRNQNTGPNPHKQWTPKDQRIKWYHNNQLEKDQRMIQIHIDPIRLHRINLHLTRGKRELTFENNNRKNEIHRTTKIAIKSRNSHEHFENDNKNSHARLNKEPHTKNNHEILPKIATLQCSKKQPRQIATDNHELFPGFQASQNLWLCEILGCLIRTFLESTNICLPSARSIAKCM